MEEPDLLLEGVDGSDSSKDGVAVVSAAAAVQLLQDGKAQGCNGFGSAVSASANLAVLDDGLVRAQALVPANEGLRTALHENGGEEAALGTGCLSR